MLKLSSPLYKMCSDCQNLALCFESMKDFIVGVLTVSFLQCQSLLHWHRSVSFFMFSLCTNWTVRTERLTALQIKTKSGKPQVLILLSWHNITSDRTDMLVRHVVQDTVSILTLKNCDKQHGHARPIDTQGTARGSNRTETSLICERVRMFQMLWCDKRSSHYFWETSTPQRSVFPRCSSAEPS